MSIKMNVMAMVAMICALLAGANPAAAQAPVGIMHIVEDGDAISKLYEPYGFRAKDPESRTLWEGTLVNGKPITNVDFIRIGDTLTLMVPSEALARTYDSNGTQQSSTAKTTDTAKAGVVPAPVSPLASQDTVPSTRSEAMNQQSNVTPEANAAPAPVVPSAPTPETDIIIGNDPEQLVAAPPSFKLPEPVNQEQINREQEAKEQAATESEAPQSRSDMWTLYVLFIVIGAVLLLIVALSNIAKHLPPRQQKARAFYTPPQPAREAKKHPSLGSRIQARYERVRDQTRAAFAKLRPNLTVRAKQEAQVVSTPKAAPTVGRTNPSFDHFAPPQDEKTGGTKSARRELPKALAKIRTVGGELPKQPEPAPQPQAAKPNLRVVSEAQRQGSKAQPAPLAKEVMPVIIRGDIMLDAPSNVNLDDPDDINHEKADVTVFYSEDEQLFDCLDGTRENYTIAKLGARIIDSDHPAFSLHYGFIIDHSKVTRDMRNNPEKIFVRAPNVGPYAPSNFVKKAGKKQLASA